MFGIHDVLWKLDLIERLTKLDLVHAAVLVQVVPEPLVSLWFGDFLEAERPDLVEDGEESHVRVFPRAIGVGHACGHSLLAELLPFAGGFVGIDQVVPTRACYVHACLARQGRGCPATDIESQQLERL